MNPPRSRPPAPVVRLPYDEQITQLVQQHERFADWQADVDQRLRESEENQKELSGKVDGLDKKVGELDTKIDGLFSKMEGRLNESLLVGQQVLIAVQGQRIPGLEVPGLTDRYVQLESRFSTFEAKTNSRLDPLENWKNRALWTGGIAAFLTSIGVLAWTEKAKAVFAIFFS